MKIPPPYEASCNYFNMFQDIQKGSVSQKVLGALKVISVATLIVPVIFGIIHQFCKPIQNRSVTTYGTSSKPITAKKAEEVYRSVYAHQKFSELPFNQAFEKWVELSTSLLNKKRLEMGGDWRDFDDGQKFLERILAASLEEIASLDQKLVDRFKNNFSKASNTLLEEWGRGFEGVKNISQWLQNVKTFADHYSEKLDSMSAQERARVKTCIDFIGKNGHGKELIPELLKLPKRDFMLQMFVSEK
jgi:hypothetical protein